MRTYIYNVSIASMLMCISDMTSQIFEGNGFDVKRNVKMTLLGGFTNGMCLTKWYRFIDVRFKGQIIPKILADQLIYSPLSISFFLITTNKDNCSLNGYRSRVNERFIDIWKSDCFVWPVFNLINFKYIPVSKQPIFTSCVDLGWNTYMSYSLHNKKLEIKNLVY